MKTYSRIEIVPIKRKFAAISGAKRTGQECQETRRATVSAFGSLPIEIDDILSIAEIRVFRAAETICPLFKHEI